MRSAFDLLSTPVWIFDTERDAVTWANKAARQLCNTDDSTTLANRNHDALSQALRERFGDDRRRLLETEGVTARWTLFPDGDPVSVDCRCSACPLPDGRTGILVEGWPVTEHEQNRLQRERHLLQGIFTSSVSAIVVAGADGAFHFANERAAEVLGVPVSDILGRQYNDPAWDMRDADGTPLGPEEYPFRIVMRTKAPFFGNRYWVADATGSRRILSINGAPIVDNDGAVVDIVFSVADVTAEEEAKAARNRLLQILEATPDFISMTDADGNVLYLSAGARRMIGLPAAPVGSLGFDVPEHGLKAGEQGHPPWARKKIVEEGIPTAIRDGVWEGETALVDSNGREIPVSQVIIAHKGRDGAVERLSTIMRDISDQRAAQRQLADAAARMERILNISPAGIYALRLNPAERSVPAHCTLVNDTMESISGYSVEEWTADPRSVWKALVHPDDLQTTLDGWETLFSEGRAEYDYRIRRTDGQERWIVDTAVLLRDDEGHPTEVVGAWQDISDRRAIEEELRRSNAELEQFAYVASHDLQEPLRMVSAYLGLLQRRYGENLDADAKQFIGFAVDGAHRMHRMINDLLTYSRVDRMGAPRVETDTAEVLDAALANLKAANTETQADVRAAGLPTVWADRNQLARLFQNLIGNAIKYRRPDVAPVIEVTAEESAREWIFSVRDNGIGIEAQFFERIFQIFQRLHTQSEVGGTGIGLAICKRIVERHGGRIWVESVPGEGSTFHFTLAKPQA